jgi:RNA polymerase sigma factor (sigma-70 family)
MTHPSDQNARGAEAEARRAEAALWRRWADMRGRVVARLVSAGWEEADAEDLFGQGLLRAWERRDRLGDAKAAEAWFWTLVRRMALDAGRAASRDLRRRAPEAEVESVADPGEAEDPCACSMRLLESLDVETRELLEAVDLQGEAVGAAAARTGLSPNAASARLFRARRSLRKRLHEQCGTTSVAECQDCGCPPQEGAP